MLYIVGHQLHSAELWRSRSTQASAPTPNSGTSYTLKTASSPPETTTSATRLPLFWLPHTTEDSLEPAASSRVARGSAERLSQTLTVPSSDADATWCSERGLHATAVTGAACALYALIACITPACQSSRATPWCTQPAGADPDRTALELDTTLRSDRH